jgi:hypothetical protein
LTLLSTLPAAFTTGRRGTNAWTPCFTESGTVCTATVLIEEGLTMVTEQEVREAHVAFAIHHC